MSRRSERRIGQPWFFWLVVPCFLLPFFGITTARCTLKGPPPPRPEVVTVSGVDLLVGGEPQVEGAGAPQTKRIVDQVKALGPHPWAWLVLLIAVAGALISWSYRGWRTIGSFLAALAGMFALISLHAQTIGFLPARPGELTGGARIGWKTSMALFVAATVTGLHGLVVRPPERRGDDPAVEAP